MRFAPPILGPVMTRHRGPEPFSVTSLATCMTTGVENEDAERQLTYMFYEFFRHRSHLCSDTA